MGTWIWSYLSSGLRAPQQSLGVCVFRIGLALAVLSKFVIEHRRGSSCCLQPGTFTSYQLRSKPRLRAAVTAVYPIAYRLKWLAVVLLLFGVVPQTAAILLVGWFVLRLPVDSLNHTFYLMLCCLCLAACAGLDDCLTWRTGIRILHDGPASVLHAESERLSDPFGQLVIVLLTSQMYLATAVRKIRSVEFRQGRVLHRIAEHLVLTSGQAPYRDAWYPGVVVRMLVAGDHEAMSRRWRPAAVGTIIVELVLPFGLAVPWLWSWFAVAGLVLHLGFTFLLPIRLIPYGLATVSSFVLFASPFMVSR
jgi:hypothetical protein